MRQLYPSGHVPVGTVTVLLLSWLLSPGAKSSSLPVAGRQRNVSEGEKQQGISCSSVEHWKEQGKAV